MRVMFHVFVFGVLTLLTQIGGLAWLIACLFKRRLFAFVVVYLCMTVSVMWIAPIFGRVPLSCGASGPLQMQSWMYCALNRNYVSPELKQVLSDTAAAVEVEFPGTETLVLDGNFPFLTGFPLLPHLSHDDGDKADLAFYYRDSQGYAPGRTRSIIGYFAFEQGPTNCTKDWPSLRWDMGALQSLWPDLTLDPDRTRYVLNVLTKDPRVGKIFVEPHLVDRLDASHDKIRFQGCRAARHDDHIHMQLD